MKIVINNIEFPFDIGCKVLKLKHANEKCPLQEVEDLWDEISEATFQEIAFLENLEQRRIAFLYFTPQKMYEQANPRLVDRQEIKKTTNWVLEDGTLETHAYTDVYELYEVEGKTFSSGTFRTAENVHFVRCKDTSTDRVYHIWVNLKDVETVNIDEPEERRADAIAAIAWTIRLTAPKGEIIKIIRQGDLPVAKITQNGGVERHLTRQEYIDYIVCES